MNVEVISESPVDLDEYARVSIGFTVAEVLDDAAVDAALRGGPIAAVPLEVPYEKNYDSHPGSRPADWRAGFDIAEWQFVAAFLDGRRVGGAVLIPNGRVGVEVLDGHVDPALLWDIRVAPAVRRQGIGAALLDHVTCEARERGATELLVETQQINVPACRFYAAHGFRLLGAQRQAYPNLPDETQLLWSKSLG